MSRAAGPIRKVAWLDTSGRRLLCARSTGRDAFYVPGGKPEAGEDDAAALCREIGEETGLALDPASIRTAGMFEAAAEGKAGIAVRVSAYRAAAVGVPRAAGEIAELRRIASTDRVPVSAVTRLILDRLKADDVID